MRLENPATSRLESIVVDRVRNHAQSKVAEFFANRQTRYADFPSHRQKAGPPCGHNLFGGGFKERADLQQLLKQQIGIIAPDTLVIAEEYGQWEDSRRRIDLLGVDKNADIVVIELKRSEDGGHMELQSLRYAAMVSKLTFQGAIDAYQQYLSSIGEEADAQDRMLEFLGWDAPNEEKFAQSVRIVLASAEFSREITTSVLWLNECGLDIKCVRMRPYKDSGRLMIDVQQVIPLPEAEQYQVQIRQKQEVERAARVQDRDLTRYDVTIGSDVFPNLPKRRAILQVIQGLCRGGANPDELAELIAWKSNAFRAVEGTLESSEFEKALAASMVKEGNKPAVHRYFIDDDELVYANGKTYALTKKWGISTSKAMDALLQRFSNHRISYRVAQPIQDDGASSS